MNTPDFWIRFILAILATWRVTHLLASEDGPFDVIAKFRALLGHSIAGKLMDCFNCLSVWIAAPAALFVTRQALDWVFVWLAISGAACLLERTAREPLMIEPAPQPFEGDEYHVLRSETNRVTDQYDVTDETTSERA